MSAPEEVIVICICEPSDAAWKRFGEIGARILENLAIRDAEAAARDIADASGVPPRVPQRR